MPDFWLGNQITFDWQIKLLTTARISCFQFVSVHAAEVFRSEKTYLNAM